MAHLRHCRELVQRVVNRRDAYGRLKILGYRSCVSPSSRLTAFAERTHGPLAAWRAAFQPIRKDLFAREKKRSGFHEHALETLS
jgi:hypothetical protein